MIRARARIRNRHRGMNKLEAAYHDHLHARMNAGEIEEFGYERIKLKLADNTFYTPDFYVVTAGGEFEIHEVKGFWEDDARVKIKVAAENFPFTFVAVSRRRQRDGGGWEFERFAQ